MEAKKFSADDFETGMMFEQEVQEAKMALLAAQTAYLLFINVLRKRHNAPEGEYELRDWAVGFVPAEGATDDQ